MSDMTAEQRVEVRVSRRMLNLLTSMMPTLEGLLLVTVLDGREGQIVIRFHRSIHGDITDFLAAMQRDYPAEFEPKAMPA